ncbi:unnamed protein product [Phyllotreta striolata]|uniref:Kinesin motor domain-containing protein n=1 Tax=Phyllotreta striolata TaxID=444603 RepID=A0A9N9XNB2_PHYSR|nr:unnamed protein product [Phyllotreta striolata]
MADNTSIRVAVRVRPLLENEISKGSKEVVEVVDANKQVVIRSVDRDAAYTFDHVFNSKTEETHVYKSSVKSLVENLFKGFNVTILAYGQTGSGKTHTMGTTYNGDGPMGIIPQAIVDIFNFVKDNFSYDFNITASFTELYQEVLYDLLSDKPRDQCTLDIREDSSKAIYIPNITEIEVNCVREVFEILEKGTSRRATSATAMNAQSSRSHAIFTLNLSMTHKEDCMMNKQGKLHLVDLAGSERPKKTLASGNTFKEGVNINRGLLALGNVISFLGDEKTQNAFVSYRDSNLTRLLKDSLGGNSITLMIACISPADYNLDETLSTLRYADRAKKIKNKPVVNQDPKTAEINALKKTIQQLKLQIAGEEVPVVCREELETVKREYAELKAKYRDISLQLSSVLVINTGLYEKIQIHQTSHDKINQKVSEFKDSFYSSLEKLNAAIRENDIETVQDVISKLQDIKNDVEEISSEQQQTDKEISDHDSRKFTTRFTPEENGQGDEPDELDDEERENHADRQLKLNVQLTELDRELNIKENLAKQLTNMQHLVDLQALQENEAKIAQLEREKEDLLQMLKNAGNSCKIAEQRRKRMQDLEQQLLDLKKKVQEQNALLKQKNKAEERVKMLNNEIVQIKQAKVKLVRSMREESDRFRQWKMEKEKECIRLKREDKKKEFEINKMKSLHNKQQNVFKRRVEEAEAINKRLKYALSLKQQAQEMRSTGKTDRLEQWLRQELDLYINLVEAEATLKVLLEDRATLQNMKDNWTDECATQDLKTIEEDLELRSIQISDLQTKLLASDEDNRSKFRIEKFQSMSEAKYGIKFLFVKLGEVVKEKVGFQMRNSELQEVNKETIEKLKNAKKIQENDELLKVQLQKYEDRIALLTKEINENAACSINESDRTTRIEQLQNENRLLNNKLLSLMERHNRDSKDNTITMPEKKELTICNTPERNVSKITLITDKNQQVIGTRIPPLKERDENEIPNGNFMSPLCEEDDDDIEKDPDWRKTPYGKFLLDEKKKISRSTINKLGSLELGKRSSDGGCTCKTNCNGRCGCRKVGRECSDLCKCRRDVCQNQEKSGSTEPHTNSDGKKPTRHSDSINGVQVVELSLNSRGLSTTAKKRIWFKNK